MTSNGTAYDRAYDKTIPTDSPEVARIMRERGVGRRRATHLATKAAAESIDVSDVDMSQKESVLRTIIKYEARNSQTLLETMNHNGYTIDGHDVVKMLWACQKMGWVTFRERKGGYGKHGERPKIFAIKVTSAGYGHVQERAVEEVSSPPVNGGSIAPPIPEPEPPKPQQPVEAGGNQAHTLSLRNEEKTSRIDLHDYPLVLELMKRGEKGIFLANAAQILESAGEEDLALAVMEKNQFTPLEDEVIRLVRKTPTTGWSMREEEES